MALIALLLALAALPFALLDLRVAAACLILAFVLAALAIQRSHWVGLGRASLIIAVVGALLAGWEWYELHPTISSTQPPHTSRRPTGPDREVWLPLVVERLPVKRLALLPLEAGSDPTYSDLEPQYIDRGTESGMRIIAYRHDGRVDLYDDLTLTPEPHETSRVTGEGRLHYRHTDLGNPILEVSDEGDLHLEFSFIDAAGRSISAHIQEHSKHRSVPMNLLAPVGLSSVDPQYFPLFLMHDFEFLRLRGTTIEVTIDGSPVSLTDFPVPVPVQGQMRSFVKSTNNAELAAVFPQTDGTIRKVHLKNDVHQEGDTAYIFDGDNLERIISGSTEFTFTPSLNLLRDSSGRMIMESHELGRISGTYATRMDGTRAQLVIDIDQVSTPSQRGLLYKLIVSDRSSFARWPKAYRFEATIDHSSHTITSRWVNEQPGG